jgi:DNA modification methylase
MVGRRCDNVGTVATKPFSEAHFAVYPPALITPCILAGCPVGGTVLDPFAGSGTTCKMAKLNGRNYIGIDIAEEYVEMARRRVEEVAG